MLEKEYNKVRTISGASKDIKNNPLKLTISAILKMKKLDTSKARDLFHALADKKSTESSEYYHLKKPNKGRAAVRKLF